MVRYPSILLALFFLPLMAMEQQPMSSSAFKNAFKQGLACLDFNKLTELITLLARAKNAYETTSIAQLASLGFAEQREQLSLLHEQVSKVDKRLSKCILLVEAAQARDRAAYNSTITRYHTSACVMLLLLGGVIPSLLALYLSLTPHEGPFWYGLMLPGIVLTFGYICFITRLINRPQITAGHYVGLLAVMSRLSTGLTQLKNSLDIHLLLTQP